MAWLTSRGLTEYRLRQEKQTPGGLLSFLTKSDRRVISEALDEANNLTFPTNPLSLLMYALTRVVTPDLVVETGIAWGYTSAAILAAMERNGRGRLCSIDLPPALTSGRRLADGIVYTFTLEKGLGWIVPDTFRRRWQVVLGDALEELPRLLHELEQIDIFLHDSLHTEEHMATEYRIAWPFIRRRGVLVSDDLNRAFLQFTRGVARPFACCESSGTTLVGAIVK